MTACSSQPHAYSKLQQRLRTTGVVIGVKNATEGQVSDFLFRLNSEARNQDVASSSEYEWTEM